MEGIMNWMYLIPAAILAWGIYWSLPHQMNTSDQISHLREKVAKIEVKIEHLEKK